MINKAKERFRVSSVLLALLLWPHPQLHSGALKVSSRRAIYTAQH